MVFETGHLEFYSYTIERWIHFHVRMVLPVMLQGHCTAKVVIDGLSFIIQNAHIE